MLRGRGRSSERPDPPPGRSSERPGQPPGRSFEGPGRSSDRRGRSVDGSGRSSDRRGRSADGSGRSPTKLDRSSRTGEVAPQTGPSVLPDRRGRAPKKSLGPPGQARSCSGQAIAFPWAALRSLQVAPSRSPWCVSKVESLVARRIVAQLCSALAAPHTFRSFADHIPRGSPDGIHPENHSPSFGALSRMPICLFEHPSMT